MLMRKTPSSSKDVIIGHGVLDQIPEQIIKHGEANLYWLIKTHTGLPVKESLRSKRKQHLFSVSSITGAFGTGRSLPWSGSNEL